MKEYPRIHSEDIFIVVRKEQPESAAVTLAR